MVYNRHMSPLSKLTDRAYLREQQYRTPENLTTRIDLHQRFSTNTYGWWLRVWNQLDFKPGIGVLEA